MQPPSDSNPSPRTGDDGNQDGGNQDGQGAGEQPLQERILNEAPRLGLDDEFQFKCHPGVSCFGVCCGDVTIALTPYDVLRLRARLGITTSEFLSKYAIVPFTKEQRLPIPILKMREDERKSCHFNDEGKCTVYEDRPWACRMYPLGLASPQEGSGDEAFYFLLDEQGCMGHLEEGTQTVRDWIGDQGIAKYNEMGELFQPHVFVQRLADGKELDPKQMQMYWMATYDLDSFRRFVFGSTFLQRFDVPEETAAMIREDDEALMRFAFDWLAFALSGKPTMKLKSDPKTED